MTPTLTHTVAVLGSGSWGTALAHHLARVGHQVTLWGRDFGVLDAIAHGKPNPRYLSGVALHPSLKTEADLPKALEGVEAIVIAVPSDAVRNIAQQFFQQQCFHGLTEQRRTQQEQPAAKELLIVSTSKGVEQQSLAPMSQVLEEELQKAPGVEARIAVLSGPSFALEVAQGKPTAVTAASKHERVAEQVAELFHYDNFRIYTSTDVAGVEFGGVYKNIIAIAAGVVDGLEMGANARAALITRGLAEMQRIVVQLGGKPTTVMGLSGLGDLLLTATGDLSRNRQVGLRLAHGEKLEDILRTLGAVAEGVKSTFNVRELVHRLQVSAPITEEVAKLLEGKRSAKESAGALLSRARKSE